MHNLNQNIVNYEQLYNKIISLTREKFFYIELNLKDEITTRIYLGLFHLAFILKTLKINKKDKDIAQNIYDFFFRNIELNIREIGYGDVSVNKKMKDLIKLFHEIIIYCEYWNTREEKLKIIYFNKLFNKEENLTLNTAKLLKYFDNFDKNLKDISLNLLLKGIINFKN